MIIFAKILMFLVIIASIVNWTITISDIRRNRKFGRLCKRMLDAAVETCGCTGHIELPTIDGPKANDVKCGPGFMFKEIDDDGRERLIFVSEDCSYTYAYPWKEERIVDC